MPPRDSRSNCVSATSPRTVAETSVARLRLQGIRKAFGATQALRGVDLVLQPGEVHALIGENGAGKSTLMKVLSGAHAPDAGRIELDGRCFEPSDPLDARRAGVAMIYQELNLAPHLSVEENILLGSTPHRWGWIHRRERAARAREALAQLGADDIPTRAPVSSLTVARQQLVEIARALLAQPKVLIMDEPTSSLTRVDTENLFRVIRRLAASGVAIVYISHFLEECQALCSRWTVLRDGESVGSGPMEGTPVEDIIRRMVGRDVQDLYPRTPHELGPTVLELRQLGGRPKPESDSLTLRRGEILGMAGLVGAGRTETLRGLGGLDAWRGGEAFLEGRVDRGAEPCERLAHGMGLLSEDRKGEGLLLNRSVSENLLMTRLGPVTRLGWVSPRRVREQAGRWIGAMEVKTAGPETPVGHLSGGNQQKVALGRLLYHDARILLLDEPTRGIDVGSKASIYRRIGEAARDGKSVVFVSSYLPELLGVCDTVAVMSRGRLVASRPASEWTEHEIIAAAIGQPEPAAAASKPLS